MLVQGTLRSAREHGLAHEVLSAADVARRYPAFGLRPGLIAVLEIAGGRAAALGIRPGDKTSWRH
jgi:sarcosine oxidase